MTKLINACFKAVVSKFNTSYSSSSNELDLQWHWKHESRYWQINSKFPFLHTFHEQTHSREFECLISHLGGSALLDGLWDLNKKQQQKVVDNWIKDYSKEELEEICKKMESETLDNYKF